MKKGATTIWESWGGLEQSDNASLNHYSYGAVSGWLISGVCGIQVRDGKLTLKPCPNELLQYAKASYDSPLGKITSGWSYEEDGLHLDFVIPSNVEAECVLPNGEKKRLEAGDHHFVIEK